MTKTIEIGDERFASKASLKRRVQEILRRGYREVTGADALFLCTLFERHPSAAEKIGPGIKSIRVRRVPPYGTTGLEIERADGSRTDISYQECITPTTPDYWFRASCRSAVVMQITDAKNRAFADSVVIRCPITNEEITRDTCHADHAPPWTFDAIVKAFIGAMDLDVSTVEFVDGDGVTESEFVDQELTISFSEFHRDRAVLRIVSRNANLSLLRRGAR